MYFLHGHSSYRIEDWGSSRAFVLYWIHYPSIDILPDFAKNRPECILLKLDLPGPGNNFSTLEKAPGFFNDLLTTRKGDKIVSKCRRLGQDARIITETSLFDREARGLLGSCAVPDVEGIRLQSSNGKNSVLPFYAMLVANMRRRARCLS